IGVNIIAADSTEEAKRLLTSSQQQMIALMRNEPTELKPPVDHIEQVASPRELISLQRTIQANTTIIGTVDDIEEKLTTLLNDTKADEIIINGQIFEQQKRLKSYELISELLTTE